MKFMFVSVMNSPEGAPAVSPNLSYLPKDIDLLWPASKEVVSEQTLPSFTKSLGFSKMIWVTSVNISMGNNVEFFLQI